MKRNISLPSYYYEEISGTSQLSLTRGAGDPLSDLKIYGNSFQGNMENNLFDKNKELDAVRTNYAPTVNVKDSSIIITGSGETARMGAWIIPTNGITSFTINAINLSLNGTTTPSLIVSQSDSFPEAISTVSTFGSGVVQLDESTSFPITVTISSAYLAIVFQVVGDAKITIDNLLIQESSTGLPSPDNPIEIECVGEKTNNLLDLTVAANDFAVLNEDGSMTFKVIFNEDGTWKQRFTNRIPIYLKANFPYCIEGIIEESSLDSTNQQINFQAYDINGVAIQSQSLADYCLGSRTFTLKQDAYSISFYLGNNETGSIRISNLQIIEAKNMRCEIIDETITEYEEFDVLPASTQEAICWFCGLITVPEENTESSFLIQFIDINGNVLWQTNQGERIVTSINERYHPTATKIRIYAGSTAELAVGNTITISLWIVHGSHEYEPYGYKIPVKARGKNLFDAYRWFSDYLDEDGKVRYTNADYTNIYKIKILEGEFKENTQYTFSVNYELTKKVESSYGVIIRFNLSDGTSVVKRLLDSNGVGTYVGNCSITNKADTTVLSACIAYNNASYEAEVLLSDIQIIEGTATAEYEPYVEPITTNIYLDEPLRKIGDYADCVDFENGKVIRNIKSINAEANGWSSYNDGDEKHATKVYRLPIATLVNNYGYHCVCNRFIGKTRMHIYNGIKGIAANDLQIRLYYVGITDISIEDFQDWVSENPISVDYILSEPIEEDIDLSKLPTFKGNVQVQIYTELPPSETILQYYRY